MFRQIKLFFRDYFKMMGIYVPVKLTPDEQLVLNLVPTNMFTTDEGFLLQKVSKLTGRPTNSLGWLLTILNRLAELDMIDSRVGGLGIRRYYRLHRGNKYARDLSPA